MAAPRAASSWRICRRYRVFFYFCFIALSIQMFLGYSFYSLNQQELDKLNRWKSDVEKMLQTAPSPKSTPNASSHLKQIFGDRHQPETKLGQSEVDRQVRKPADDVNKLTEVVKKKSDCTKLSTKEALSAYSRATTDSCKQEILDIVCSYEQRTLYPSSLPRLCHVKGKEPFGKYFGCFKDNQKDRDVPNFSEQFPKDNSPEKCTNFCLTGSYMYAGVQYKDECWCGNSHGKYGLLPETSCSSVCPGNSSETCGGYNSQRIFSTGLPEKKSIKAELVYNFDLVRDLTRVRIVFVLTVNGRAVRQVRRLINTLYDPNHYFYIHVDSRSEYMYRELLPLEEKLHNVRLSKERFATIWGGASLLQAHLTFMKCLLEMSDWHWDYYINLSESDYPIKTVESLTVFLTRYRGNNFLKSNGRETPTFIKKQGLNWLFHECDNHLWRLGKCELPLGIQVDGGSDWIGLYRDFVQYSLTSTDTLITGLKQFYKYTLLPVESFFHVLLLNSEFCESWIDNNLHLTNWKRKQGCKCQHKKQVDWCGCSPNDFKMEDLDRLLTYKGKVAFFARKYEPVVSQEIINSVDNFMGRDISDLPGLNRYWHNDYHYKDQVDWKADLWLTFAGSFVRHNQQVLGSATSQCTMSDIFIIESHVLNLADSFHRYLVKYNVTLPGRSVPVTLESQYSYKQHYRIIDPLGPIGRLQNLEVGTDFDPKELVFRNYPKFLGPNSEVALRHVWGYGTETTLSVAWIDPVGIVAVYQDITVTKETRIDAHKPKLKAPLRPGVWTVKLLYRLKVCAEVQFVVLPYSTQNNVPLTRDQAISLHNGPQGLYSHTNYSDFTEKLGIKDSAKLYQESVINGRKVGPDLEAWIDKLSAFSWSVQDTCSVFDLGQSCPPIDLCVNTRWSSLSPDPKSEISQIMLSNLKI
ncbi:xylosyltransferase 2-like [Mercenaria mercenaria]|uniref:xylosyltransferase 2-like n=1 Tax=Mercenaria mercenaria TaxID=6596 RepID=UPI00234EFE22|nr:xylosyltransferase 2-like [Mercenaria mercenaria]